MAKPVDVTVGILAWNARQMIEDLLTAVFAQPWRYAYKWVVVDNGSADGTVEMIRRRFPEAQLIANPRNEGVAARNQIVQAAEGRYVGFLDADTMLHDCALDTLVQAMDARADIAIAAPRLIYEDGRLQLSCRTFPSFFHVLGEGTPLKKVFGRTRFVREYTMEDWDHATTREVDWVYGACFLCRREVLDAVGGFDRRFRFKYEDVDLCFRTKQKGYKTVYIPEATVTHFLRGEARGIWHPLLATHVKSVVTYLAKDYYGWAR